VHARAGAVTEIERLCRKLHTTADTITAANTEGIAA
jgi:hypothetical protein